ncbi:MAG: arsinothricin resistance N-acetyltransferase ArsN1 family B [Pseudomonadota bacterium]
MIRSVTPQDAAALCAIYNHYVVTTTISFEEAMVSTEDMVARIGASRFPWLVLEEEGRLLAYAYAAAWRVRPAYRYAVESSVYVAHGATGRGLGQRVYAALLASLRALDLHTVIGGIALPNDASVRLHEGLGFRKVAHFEEVGYKHGRRIDVGYWQLHLRKDIPA